MSQPSSHPVPPSPRTPVLVMVPGARRGAQAPPLEVVEEGADHLLVTDLGVTRGDGAFETIGVFDGTAVNVGPHLARLARSGRALDLPELDLERLEQAIDLAISAHVPAEEITLRVIVTRGPENGEEPTAWIHARIADDYSAERAGLAVVTLDRGLPTTVMQTSPWLLAGAKTLSYAVNMAVLREAKRQGADEVLFVSSDGWCLEGPTSTLLVHRGDEWITTPADAGVLPGTSVATVGRALEARGETLTEALLRPEEVAASDGAWLLSSSRLAAPIRRLDEAELPVDETTTAWLLELLSGRA